jgi:hypothetical protein
MADYGEIFCTAVNEIVQQKLNSLNYDITKDCTVVSVDNKIKNEYTVSDGSSTFVAYAAAGTSYELGDQVLVTIPQGNYNKQKTIINKITMEVSSNGYVSPLDTFHGATANFVLVGNNIKELEIETSEAGYIELDKIETKIQNFN